MLRSWTCLLSRMRSKSVHRSRRTLFQNSFRRAIIVEQQVEKDAPRIVEHLKTTAAEREIDLHPDIAEYLQRYTAGKTGLLFHTSNGTPHLYGNLEDHWLTPRLIKMGLDEQGMGWHAFKKVPKNSVAR